jgi:hypothetical protein
MEDKFSATGSLAREMFAYLKAHGKPDPKPDLL